MHDSKLLPGTHASQVSIDVKSESPLHIQLSHSHRTNAPIHLFGLTWRVEEISEAHTQGFSSIRLESFDLLPGGNEWNDIKQLTASVQVRDITELLGKF